MSSKKNKNGISFNLFCLTFFVVHLFIGGMINTSYAQKENNIIVDRIEAEPNQISMQAGETKLINITAYSPEGEILEGVEYRYRAPRLALEVIEGEITGLKQGDYEVRVSIFPAPEITWTGDRRPSLSIPVKVDWPEIVDIQILDEPYQLYVGTSLDHEAKGFHNDGSQRPEPDVEWRSSDTSIAKVDQFGRVEAIRSGNFNIHATIGGKTEIADFTVRPFPAETLVIYNGKEVARTGDVIHFEAVLKDSDENRINDLKIRWSYDFKHEDSRAARGASAEIEDGTFVAEQPGVYTIYAHSGSLTSSQRLVVEDRDVVRQIRQVGHGRIDHTRTTDFWVFEGNDGKDYAISGSKDAGGKAFIWNVTNPENPIITDSVKVDARSVNDVKVSPDSRYAVMTREGASDRRNGLVLLDLSNPAHPEIAISYTQGLTGGVHNTWPEKDVLFALTGGEKYIILDVSDIYNPKYISEYNHPNSRIHDLIFYDGLILSAEWDNGVVIVDVGNGMAGGSLENPKFVTNYTLPGGNTHDVIPYLQESTGKLYLFAGDEVMSRRGMALEGPLGAYRLQYNEETDEGGIPPSTAGYIHIIDFTDFDNPRKVARYYVEEYGTHNIWIEDDILYQAHYEGGFRMVDISGELKGDLKQQGREMSVYKTFDPGGYVSNAPMVWSAMPYKGKIYLSDTNSGLWILEVLSEDVE